jgi:hypothetical protein
VGVDHGSEQPIAVDVRGDDPTVGAALVSSAQAQAASAYTSLARDGGPPDSSSGA